MSNEIDNEGFENLQPKETVGAVSSGNEAKSGKSITKWFVLAVIIIGVAGVAGYKYLNQPVNSAFSLDDEVDERPTGYQQPVGQISNAAENNTIGNDIRSIPEKPEFEMENNDGEIKIGGINNLIAQALLGNYPTFSDLDEKIKQVKGADVSKAELDVFLIAVTENTKKIAKLLEQGKRNHNISLAANELNKLNVELKKQGLRGAELVQVVDDLKDQMLVMAKKVEKISKNTGWYHNRITKLEGKKVPSKKRTVVKAKQPLEVRRLELNSKTKWRVKGAAEKVAFITSKEHSRPIRVTVGYDIPGCGLVTEISAADQRVNTTSCIIEN